MGCAGENAVDEAGHHGHATADDGEIHFRHTPESDGEIVPAGIRYLGDICDQVVQLCDTHGGDGESNLWEVRIVKVLITTNTNVPHEKCCQKSHLLRW